MERRVQRGEGKGWGEVRRWDEREDEEDDEEGLEGVVVRKPAKPSSHEHVITSCCSQTVRTYHATRTLDMLSRKLKPPKMTQYVSH